jgi:Flp pilus assembly protein TadB
MARGLTLFFARTIHRYIFCPLVQEEGSFNRRVFAEKHRLDGRMRARQLVHDKIAACKQRQQDDLLGRIQRVEARAKAHGMDVRCLLLLLLAVVLLVVAVVVVVVVVVLVAAVGMVAVVVVVVVVVLLLLLPAWCCRWCSCW